MYKLEILSQIIEDFSVLSKLNYSTIKDKLHTAALDKLLNEELEVIIEYLIKDSRKNVQVLGKRIQKQREDKIKEVARVKTMYDFDACFGINKCIAGVDEVGRGPLAGPIVAASVILNANYLKVENMILNINDSKKISPQMREVLSELIKEKAIEYKITAIDNEIIDEKGIAWCNNEVLKIACTSLKTIPDLVISDGYPIKGINLNNEYIIKGDAKSACIACASIIAKVFRDNIMHEYAKKYPEYGFDRNAGYGTLEHINAIKKYGITKIHRKSFLTNIIF